MKHSTRMVLWYGWCMALGVGIGAAGVSIADHPFWFLAIDTCFIFASVNAIGWVYPTFFDKDEDEPIS